MCSMGKAIDALYNASVQIEQDGTLYLDEKFMNEIFNEIYTDQDGNDAPLPPLEEAMQYQYEVKQTPALDGSKVLPFDQLNAELFYPTRKENIDTNKFIITDFVKPSFDILEGSVLSVGKLHKPMVKELV